MRAMKFTRPGILMIMPARKLPLPLTSTFKGITSVRKAIASDTWTFADRNGKTQRARVEIGKPQPVPDDELGDWHCPVFIEGWTPNVMPVMGIGPVDSLMNAVSLVRSFHEQIASAHITHGAGRKKRSKRRT